MSKPPTDHSQPTLPRHALAGDLQDQLEVVAPLVDLIWTQIASLAEGKKHVRVLFTSPQNQAGTTLMTAATSAALARNMRANVMMVETHMRAPAAAAYLGTESTPGFSDLLLGHTEMETAVRDVPGSPDLHLLPGGSPRPAIAGEFSTRGAQDLLQSLMTKARFVLFDAPPLIEYREARGLLGFVDAAVIVLQSRVSLKSQTVELADLIENARVPILGTVLNRHESEFSFLQGRRR